MPLTPAQLFRPQDLLTGQETSQGRREARLALCRKLGRQAVILAADGSITPGRVKFRSRHAPPGQQAVEFACHLQCTTCTGTTVAGGRCSNRVCIGVPLCHLHALKYFHVRAGQTLLRLNHQRLTFGALFACDRAQGANAIIFRPDDPIICYAGESITTAENDLRYGAGDDAVGPYVIDNSYGNGNRRFVAQLQDGACRRTYMALANTVTNQEGYAHRVGQQNQTPNCKFWSEQLRPDGNAAQRRVKMGLLVATRIIRNGEELLVDTAASPYPLPGPHSSHSTIGYKPSARGCPMRGRGRGVGRGGGGGGRGGRGGAMVVAGRGRGGGRRGRGRGGGRGGRGGRH